MLGRLKFEWLSFLSALGLMSRIPVDLFLGEQNPDSEHYNHSQVWYPFVGVVLGVFLLAWAWMAPAVWSHFLSAAILVVIWVSYTGALHLDGLADTVDAWVGGIGSAEKTLSIMKDPTSGPMAVVALVLLLLLKVALVAEILLSLHGRAFILLALVPLLARAWLLPFLYKTPYARKKKFDARNVQTSELAEQQGGMATDIASTFPGTAALISFLSSQAIVLLSVLFLGWSLSLWLALNLGALFLCVLLHRACMSRIGGYTGDVLGTFIELQELVLLLVLTLSVTLSV